MSESRPELPADLLGRSSAKPAMGIAFGPAWSHVPESYPGFERLEDSEPAMWWRGGDTPLVCWESSAHAPVETPLRAATRPARLALRTGLRGLIAVEQAMESRVDADALIVADHVNGLGDNPLIGPDDSGSGSRFVDMSGPYVASLRQFALSCAETVGIRVAEGVYYSTRTHVDLACDALGPGVAPETILAAQFGVPVLAVVTVAETAERQTLSSRVAEWLLEVGEGWVETGKGVEPPGRATVS